MNSDTYSKLNWIDDNVSSESFIQGWYFHRSGLLSFVTADSMFKWDHFSNKPFNGVRPERKSDLDMRLSEFSSVVSSLEKAHIVCAYYRPTINAVVFSYNENGPSEFETDMAFILQLRQQRVGPLKHYAVLDTCGPLVIVEEL